ncbi:MAG: AI-2E family transporter, partial [Dehalococcoidia bacterium]
MPISISRQRVRIAMVTTALLVVAYLLWTARGSLTPFLVGAVFVLVFAPVVDAAARAMPFCERHPDLALSLSIGLVYLALLSALISASVALGPVVLGEGKGLANGLPSLVERTQHELQDNNGWYQRNVPSDIRIQIDQNWRQLASKAGDFGQEVISRTFDFATSSLTTVVSYIVTPFWAFFVLKDRRRGVRYVVGLFPPRVQPDVEHLITNARVVFGSYLRAQLALSTVTGVVTALGLAWFGVRFSVALGVVAGIANLIPVLGPMIGGIPTLIVVTATHPGWQILWVFLFLFVAQEIKDFVLVPRIQGRAVHIHPAVILILIVVAGRIAGFWGLLFAVPVAAVARDAFAYIYRRLGDEPTPDLLLVMAGSAEAEAARADMPPASPLPPPTRTIVRSLRRP